MYFDSEEIWKTASEYNAVVHIFINVPKKQIRQEKVKVASKDKKVQMGSPPLS